MNEPTPEQQEQQEQAGQALFGAFARCVSGQGQLRDWQLLHTAIFGAPFQIVVGQPQQEQANGTDKSAGT